MRRKVQGTGQKGSSLRAKRSKPATISLRGGVGGETGLLRASPRNDTTTNTT